MNSEKINSINFENHIRCLKEKYNKGNHFLRIKIFCDENLCHLSYENSTPKEFNFSSYSYIIFTFLKIIDSASLLKENEMHNSKLFYNDSDWTIENIIKDYLQNDDLNILKSNINDYINGFNDSIQEIFRLFMFDMYLEFLKENEKLFDFILGIFIIKLRANIFLNLNNIQNFYNKFIDFIKYNYCDVDISEWGFSHYYNFSNNLIFSLVIDSLEKDDIKNKKEISIFNPTCYDGELLVFIYNFIKEKNSSCKINIYGFEKNFFAFAVCLSRMLFLNQNIHNFIHFSCDVLYCINPENFKVNSKIINLDEKLFHSLNLYHKTTFDYIISDFGYSVSINEHDNFFLKEIFLPNFIHKYNKKLIFTLPYSFFVDISDLIKDTISNNELEAIIRLPVSPLSKRDTILILNHDKNNDKFILIDESFKSPEKFPLDFKMKDTSFLENFYEFKKSKNSRVIYNTNVGKFFNFYHLMHGNNNIFENPIEYKYLGEIVNFSQYLNFYGRKNSKKFDLIFINFLDSENIVHYYKENLKNDFPNNALKELFKSICICINSERILKEYLYYYLNSNKGKNDIFEYSSNKTLKINELYYIPIPIPSITDQKKIIETSRKMQKFFTDMDIWKNDYLNNILDYKLPLKAYKEFSCAIDSDDLEDNLCPRWKIVYQGLPLPLSYSYLRATKISNNESITQNNCLRLFEFLTTFNVIILISYIKFHTRYDDFISKIWKLNNNNKKTWHRMSFGSWTVLFERLPKIINNNKFDTFFDRNLFYSLSQKKYITLFNNLRKRRNDESHSGFEDEIDVTIKLEKLQTFVDEDIYDILKLYSGFKLYYITPKKEEYSRKKTKYIAKSLNGPCNPPMECELIEEKNLNVNSLYLYDPLNKSYLQLDNDLIKCRMIPNDDAKRWGIYFFDSVKLAKDGAIKYISYKCYEYSDFWKIEADELMDDESFNNISDEFMYDVLCLDEE